MRKPSHSRLRAALLPLALGTCASIGLQAVSAPTGQAGHPRHAQPADQPGAANRLGRFLGIGWSDGYHACRGCCEASPAAVTSYPAWAPAAVAAPPLPAAPWPAGPVEWLPTQPATDAVPEEFSPPASPPEVFSQLLPPAAAAPQVGMPQGGSVENLPTQERLSSHSPRRLPKPAGLERERTELSVLLEPPGSLRPVSLPLRPWEPNR